MTTELSELETVLQTYFDGLHESDVGKLRGIFHETCHLVAVIDGKFNDMSREQWFDRLAGNPSARSRGLARHDCIVTIDRSGPETAFAKVHCALPPRFFTDYLTLLKLAEGWRVVSKTYRVETR